MTHQTLPDTARATAVRATLVAEDLQHRVLEALERRVTPLRQDPDLGSQTAEYAMVGGIGAASAGALIACIKNKDVIGRIVEELVRLVIRYVREWF